MEKLTKYGNTEKLTNEIIMTLWERIGICLCILFLMSLVIVPLFISSVVSWVNYSNTFICHDKNIEMCRMGFD